MDSEDVRALRRSLKALRESTEENTAVHRELVEETRKLNSNIDDVLTVAEQLLPLAEGAAAGSSVLQMAIPAVKTFFRRRKSKRGD